MVYPVDENIKPDETLLELARVEGEQTKITDNIRMLANEIDPENKLHGIALVREVCAYVRTMLPIREELQKLHEDKPELFYDPRSRTAEQLVDPTNLLPNRRRARNISGCIETAHITRALLLAKGFPCLYTETLQQSWCSNNAGNINLISTDKEPIIGHVFIDTFIEEEGRWITVDPNDQKHDIHEYGDYIKDGETYVYPKSAKDSWDLGFTTMGAFRTAIADFFSQKK